MSAIEGWINLYKIESGIIVGALLFESPERAEQVGRYVTDEAKYIGNAFVRVEEKCHI